MNQKQISSSKGNILAVDDIPENLHLLVEMLSKQGYKVRIVPSGKLAINAAKANPPDLILLDILMPEMDGYQVCQALKADKQTKEIPVIFISALNEGLDKVKAFEVGGADYITKPFQAQEVIARVKYQLRLKAQAKQLAEQNKRLRREIARHKQTETKLNKSKEFLKQAQNVACIGNWEFDVLTQKITWSEEMFRIFGLAPTNSEPTYKEHIEQIHPQDRALWKKIVRQALVDGKFYKFDFRIVRKDGGVRYVEARGQGIFNEQRQVIKLFGTILDITQRKRTEVALQESEAQTRAILCAIPDLMFRLNVAGQYLGYVRTNALTDVLPEGFNPVGKNISEYLAPEHAQRHLYHLRQALATGEVQIYEQKLWLNGRWQHEEVRVVKSGEDEALFMIRDISKIYNELRRRQEAEAALDRQLQHTVLLQQITEEIRQSLDIQQIFETTALRVGEAFGVNRCLIHSYRAEPIPKIPFVAEYLGGECQSILHLEVPIKGNPHAQQLLQQEQAIVSDDVYADPLLADAQPLCRGIGLKSMLAIATFYNGEPNGIIGLHQCDRYRHWTPAEIELLEAVAAQVGIALAQAQLLNREQQQREQLLRQNQILEQTTQAADTANRAKSEFLANMSHELRTPLNAILGFTEVMNRDPSLTSEQQKHLDIINRSGEHLLALINDVLEMSKIEAGRITYNESSFDLDRFLNTLEDMLRVRANAKGLELTFERAPDVPHYIKSDENKLRQILINLLGNAIKFTALGGVTLRVSFGRKLSKKHPKTQNNKPNQTLYFEVEDTGVGITPEDINRIFQPFIQTAIGYKSTEGTGLGLSISHKFVQLMGGEMTVTSQPGQGSVFAFDIPITSAEPDALDSKPSQRIIGLAPEQPQYRLLVAEDKWTNRQLLVKLLTEIGFEVREAKDGQEAIEIWESWQPHLILMDVRMPVMDGYEATKQIRAMGSRGAGEQGSRGAEGQGSRGAEGDNSKPCPRAKRRVKTHNSNAPCPMPHAPCPNPKIIALSASAFSEERANILAAGCDDFIGKPFREDQLLETLARHLGVRYIYEELERQALTNLSPPAGERESPAPEERPLAFYLSQMPADWVKQFYDAALIGDDELMFEHMAEIPAPFAPLRRTMTDWANEYRFDKVTDFIESVNGCHSP
jgi:PAS domain S-box-containing protein